MSVTIAQGFKRLGLPLAAAVLALLVALMGMSWFLNRDSLRRAVEAQIRAVTGLDFVVNGGVDISVFPGSYVSFHSVGLKGSGEANPVLSVDTLTANLRLLPLLMRRFEIADVMMLRPRIAVTRDKSGESNWTSFIENVSRNLKPGGTPLSFSEIRIQDGTLDYRNEVTGSSETVGDIDLSLAWPSISRSFAATGQFDWRGERIDGSISFGDFLAALSGERSSLKARLSGAPMKIAFDGAVANRNSVVMEGVLTADSVSLRNAMRWIGSAPSGQNGFGRFALKARASLVGSALALTNVNIELDGNAAEGVMTYTSNGRAALQATLAANTLDFTPYLSTFRLLAPGARDWNRQLFDFGMLAATDLDMRLSASKLTIGSSVLGRTALGANLRGGALSLSVGEAQMCSGIVKGTLGLGNTGEMPEVKAQFQFIDIDLQTCSSELLGAKKISGRGTVSVALEASGNSPFALASSLDGAANLTAQDGAISGFNVETLLRRLERRPLSGGGNFRNGQTPFSSLKTNIKFSDGTATVEDMRLDGPAARLQISGTASVPQREYDLKGIASLTGSTPGFELPFVIQGPWDEPLIFPDPESLLRRSPASAPLLDAMKDRKAKDAVRSVLERITGKSPSDAETGTDSPSPSIIQAAPAPKAE